MVTRYARTPQERLALFLGKALTRFHSSYVANPESGCWEWHGTVEPRTGRPVFRFLGKRDYPPATHFAIEYVAGLEVPRAYQTKRTCGNSLCVNPEHITFREVYRVARHNERYRCCVCGKLLERICDKRLLAFCDDICRSINYRFQQSSEERLENILEHGFKVLTDRRKRDDESRDDAARRIETPPEALL